ncbi:MAG: hypothetical protein AAGJ93_05575 [Bacteroidota bacterium]
MKVDDHLILKEKNRIFVNKAIPALNANGFEQSPFTSSWYGKNNLHDYTYELCRLNTNSLEYLTTDIILGDKFIQIYLNIFSLDRVPESLDALKEYSGLQFQLQPNISTRMRLRDDDIQTIPLLNFTEYKIGRYLTQKGFKRRVKELEKLIENDMSNIDSFVSRWHELHTPITTDWEGKLVE